MKAQQMLNTDPLQLTKNHYKIRGRSDFDWHAYDKVRFEVSLNSEQHEGKKVEAIAEWLHRHFGHVVVLVGDVLHRYNYILDKSCADMEEAFVRSIKQGQEWSTRNGHSFLQGTPIRNKAVTLCWELKCLKPITRSRLICTFRVN